jgi:hypothetical protein
MMSAAPPACVANIIPIVSAKCQSWFYVGFRRAFMMEFATDLCFSLILINPLVKQIGLDLIDGRW